MSIAKIDSILCRCLLVTFRGNRTSRIQTTLSKLITRMRFNIGQHRRFCHTLQRLSCRFGIICVIPLPKNLLLITPRRLKIDCSLRSGPAYRIEWGSGLDSIHMLLYGLFHFLRQWLRVVAGSNDASMRFLLPLILLSLFKYFLQLVISNPIFTRLLFLCIWIDFAQHFPGKSLGSFQRSFGVVLVWWLDTRLSQYLIKLLLFTIFLFCKLFLQNIGLWGESVRVLLHEVVHYQGVLYSLISIKSILFPASPLIILLFLLS